jgi:UDP-3-O-[3-hydroxymyristoyl] glucosamine N-acyltransferase
LELSLGEIARLVDGRVVGDEGLMITGVNSLAGAGPGEISFFAGRRYRDAFRKTKASAVFVQNEEPALEAVQVVVPNPELAYAKTANLFVPPVPRYPGVSKDAIIHDSSEIGKNVSVYPGVYIGEEAVIGERAILFPGVFVGDRVRIGKETLIYPNVTILHECLIGDNVIIHAGCVIGSDGFGYVRDDSAFIKIPQTGIVQIDDHVEIGANSCIDRAAFGKTWIKRGAKLDNLVQIAHNVVIGEGSIIVAQAGISGSVNIGRGVLMGGQVGIADHLEIGDGAMIAPQAGVAKSILPGAVVSGTPAIPHRVYLKAASLMSRLPQLNARLRNLEKRMEEQEKEIRERRGKS